VPEKRLKNRETSTKAIILTRKLFHSVDSRSSLSVYKLHGDSSRKILTRSTPNSSALDFGNIFRPGWPNLRDMECERIKCKWTIGAAGWAAKY